MYSSLPWCWGAQILGLFPQNHVPFINNCSSLFSFSEWCWKAKTIMDVTANWYLRQPKKSKSVLSAWKDNQQHNTLEKHCKVPQCPWGHFCCSPTDFLILGLHKSPSNSSIAQETVLDFASLWTTAALELPAQSQPPGEVHLTLQRKTERLRKELLQIGDILLCKQDILQSIRH